MPYYRFGRTMGHIKLGKNSPAPAPCRALVPASTFDSPPPGRDEVPCCAISMLLCDWDLGDGRTCDMPLCTEHATEVGPDRHLCPQHAGKRGLVDCGECHTQGCPAGKCRNAQA